MKNKWEKFCILLVLLSGITHVLVVYIAGILFIKNTMQIQQQYQTYFNIWLISMELKWFFFP